MLVTPYDLQDKIIMPVKNIPDKNVRNDTFQYKNKIKAAVIVFILFILLSHKVAFKILDLILKVFSNNVNILDDDENNKPNYKLQSSEKIISSKADRLALFNNMINENDKRMFFPLLGLTI